MFNQLKLTFVRHLLPLSQHYIRHAPFSLGKRFLWKMFSWREFTRTTHTSFGDRIKVRINDLVQGYIYFFGVWEPNLTAFVKSRLKDNSERTFIDVGANIGYFTLLGAKLLPKGNVVSIEAFPSLYDRLLENISLNKYHNVRAVNLAATDKESAIPMYHAHCGNEGATTSIQGKFDSEPIIVKGLPLSDILSETEIASARLIKIDVEGAEYSVFCGLHSILNKMPDDVEVVIELNPKILTEDEMSYILSSFREAGFFPYVLNNSYDPEYYLFSQDTSPPKKMKEIPVLQTDIIFSRINREQLAI